MSRSILFQLAVFGFLLLGSCKKEEPPVNDPPVTNDPSPATQSKVVVSMATTFGSQDFALQKWFINDKGDSVLVSKFIYYLSNVVLTKSDGSKYTAANSYHLLNFTNGSTPSFTLADVPAGEYTAVDLLIGIDSLRNCSGSQTGDLDPVKGMFWTWNSGYIFLKLEGKAPQSPVNDAFTYHIGGYKGVNKSQRAVKINFGSMVLKPAAGATAQLQLKTDVAEFFKNPTQLDVSTSYYVMNEGAAAAAIADNYKDMISLKGVINP
jgi:hypothetical protein